MRTAHSRYVSYKVQPHLHLTQARRPRIGMRCSPTRRFALPPTHPTYLGDVIGCDVTFTWLGPSSVAVCARRTFSRWRAHALTAGGGRARSHRCFFGRRFRAAADALGATHAPTAIPDRHGRWDGGRRVAAAVRSGAPSWLVPRATSWLVSRAGLRCPLCGSSCAGASLSAWLGRAHLSVPRPHSLVRRIGLPPPCNRARAIAHAALMRFSCAR
jgi:hypothetical protein